VPEVPRRGRDVGPGNLLLILGRGQELGLDAELAERQPLVGQELDRGPAGERQPFAAGVFEQVVRQLLAKRRLVACELLAVLR